MQGIRTRPPDEDGSRPHARDLEGGSRGLSGNSYVVGELDLWTQVPGRASASRIYRVPITVRVPRRCGHCETVCAECAEVWMYDWVFHFGRTAGGRRLRDALGGQAALDMMAARRAAFEAGLRADTAPTAG